MGKRMLVTSTDLMMIQFLVPHIQNLAAHGFEMEIACSNVGGRLEEIRAKLKGYVKAIHVVRLVRSPASLINLKGYQDMKKIVDKGHFDIIWTNEPVMGVVTRLAARKVRKKGTKVLYMVHGLHFYKGAPKLNWMIYYPIERYMSRLADVIVTINKEDYARAKGFYSKKVEYIHGIGVDTDRLKERSAQGNIREELGFSKEDFIVVSVGELNKNKNHKTIIQAVSLLKEDHIKYVICGKGILQKQLEETAEKYGISGQVFFLGYRKDVVDICSQSDVFAFPSYREGLGLAPLEAMYVGLPIVASDIRGVKDYVINGKTGFLCHPGDSKAFAQAILKLKNDEELRRVIGQNNYEAVVPYCLPDIQAGTVTLSGSQALVHARNRSLDSDFGRTGRQRDVMYGIYQKILEKRDVSTLLSLINYCLTQVKTNLSVGEIYDLATSVLAEDNLQTQQGVVPMDGTYQSVNYEGMAVLDLDLEANKQRIQELLY